MFMERHKSKKLLLHKTALLIEVVGTAFIFLDSVRMNAQLRAVDASYAGGPPPGYQAWYFDSGPLGFALLFAGMIFAGFVLYLEHKELKIENAESACLPPQKIPKESPSTLSPALHAQTVAEKAMPIAIAKPSEATPPPLSGL
jgi:hypothetical protein